MADPPIKEDLESEFLLGQSKDVVARLEACLDSDARNIRPGKRDPKTVDGQAVIAIQEALKKLRATQTDILEIKDAPGDYGVTTKAAVKAYKAKHKIQRTGQPLDDIVGRMTLTQIDDDLNGGRGKRKTQPPTVKTQDILIEIGGFDKPEQQGKRREADEKVARELFSTTNYLQFHTPLEVMAYTGGDSPNPVKEIIGRLDPLIDPDKRSAPIGRVFVHGGSAGGRNVMAVVRHLRGKGVDVTYSALWDAAFQKEDLVDPSEFGDSTNFNPDRPATLRMKGLGVKMNEGAILDNFFQSWGHCLDRSQEIHGAVEGFTQTDLTNSPGVAAVRAAFESRLIERGKSRQEALENAHKAAFFVGRTRAGAKISGKLRQLPLS